MNRFRLLTLAAFTAATIPRLAHRGMFVDGVTYASIARNLAQGRGTFWHPSYTATIYPEFYEHPPLGFWLQSLWFRILGDHLFIERAYSVAIAAATATLVALIWRRMNAGTERSQYEWLPIALWITVPVVSWSVVGNLLETTMTLFTTGAAAAVVYGALSRGAAAQAGLQVVSGLCIAAAALTKGPVGLFPLAAPLILFHLFPTRRACLRALATQWATIAVCAALLAGWPSARGSLLRYLSQQVAAAVAGEREVSAGSLTILKELIAGVALPMTVVCGLIVAVARRLVPASSSERRNALAWLLLGLSGTLPILISAKQAGHYLVPAVPFYALAVSTFLGPSFELADRRVTSSTKGPVLINALVVAVFAIATLATLSPNVGRDRERIRDLDVVAAAVPRGATIGICPEANGDWGLHAWFERRFLVSLDAKENDHREWFLDTGVGHSGCPPAECTPRTDPARKLILMKCPTRE